MVPAQIQAEWLEYQLIFSDLLNRQSAMLARAAKEERKRLRRLSESREESSAQDPHQHVLPLQRSSFKAQLRSAAADRLGLGPLRQKLQPEPHQVEESAG